LHLIFFGLWDNTTCFSSLEAFALGSLANPLSPGKDGGVSRKPRALTNKLTASSRLPTLDPELIYPLPDLDKRGVRNGEGKRRTRRADAQKEMRDSNTHIVADFGTVVEKGWSCMQLKVLCVDYRHRKLPTERLQDCDGVKGIQRCVTGIRACPGGDRRAPCSEGRDIVQTATPECLLQALILYLTRI
jgi:hypothetical protein